MGRLLYRYYGIAGSPGYILSGITRQQIICLQRSRHHLVAAHGMDVTEWMYFLHVLVVCSRISAKTARRMRKDAELHIKSHTWQTKKEKEKVLFRIQITPSVLLLDWVRAQVVSSKKCYFSDLQAYSKQHCKMCVCVCVCVCVPGFLSSAQ
jgi:hypothetical protein